MIIIKILILIIIIEQIIFSINIITIITITSCNLHSTGMYTASMLYEIRTGNITAMGRSLYDYFNIVVISGTTFTISIYFKRLYDRLSKCIQS